jgi:hypothetical protein
MTLIAFEDGKPVFRDGKVGTGVACCCGCDCNWPRQITLTISNIDPGYTFVASGGGYPASGKFFEPACEEPDGFVWVSGTSGIGPSWSARSFFSPAAPILLEYDEQVGSCEVPVWTGTLVGGLRTVGLGVDNAASCTEIYTTAYVSLRKLNPTISVDFSSGSAEASVTQVNGSSGAITEITITNAGSDYAYLEVIRSAPTLSVQVNSTDGEDAAFSITLAETTDDNGDPVWTISGITVTNAGTDYEIGDTAEIVVTDGETDFPAWVSLNLTRTEPTVSASVNTSTGSGADLAVVLSSYTDGNGDEVWYVDSITVVNGGTGYDPADTVTISVLLGTEIAAAEATLSVVAGVIDSVSVYSYGEYAHTDGTVAGITVQDGGQYYKETVTDNVIVNTPAVHIISNIGSGGQITAVVDDDPDSPTFGQVAGITITNGGSGYRLTGVYRQIDVFFNLGDNVFGGRLAATYIEPSTILCYGESLSPYIPPLGTLASQTACGNELLDSSYPIILEGLGAQFGFSSVPDGAVYSSRDAFGFCNDLNILDTGSGQITCTIAPA